MFTLYRVDADYIEQRGNVIGPSWTCTTVEDANELAGQLWATRRDLTNISIQRRTYGYH